MDQTQKKPGTRILLVNSPCGDGYKKKTSWARTPRLRGCVGRAYGECIFLGILNTSVWSIMIYYICWTSFFWWKIRACGMFWLQHPRFWLPESHTFQRCAARSASQSSQNVPLNTWPQSSGRWTWIMEPSKPFQASKSPESANNRVCQSQKVFADAIPPGFWR